jgi:hypothetical protein
MTRFAFAFVVPAFLGLAICAAQAKEKVAASCFYESGQVDGHPLSDFTILNSAAFPIPKGTVVSFTTTGAPGKTFTTKPAADIASHDTFSSGGSEPMGACEAWWFK